jgi:hypothetical protein
LIQRFNNNPNDAIFLAPSLQNVWLSNFTNGQQHWYFFAGNAGTQLTVALESPQVGCI